MKARQQTKKTCTLIGLLAMFLFSSVALPGFVSPDDFDANDKVHFSASPDKHTAQNLPLPPPEEVEEEESRTDKHHTLIISFLSVVFEKAATRSAEPTTWEFNHTNGTALSDFPIYLAQHLLLI